jgi:hypothetical protein
VYDCDFESLAGRRKARNKKDLKFQLLPNPPPERMAGGFRILRAKEQAMSLVQNGEFELDLGKIGR